jgi:hypothetical protein
MNKLKTLAALRNQMDSFYSLEQVIGIIEGITEEKSRTITTVDIARAIDKVVENFEMNPKDIVDCDNIEFGIGYHNTIEIDNIDVNSDYIREALENVFMDFGEVENDEEVDLNKI